MRGSSTSTALAIDRRRGVGRRRASRASTVTLSAMPSEKLRPRQPEVAMPRTGIAASIANRPSGAAPRSARAGSATMPTSNDAPGARCSAMSPPLLT